MNEQAQQPSADVLRLVEVGDKIKAIKRYRQASGLGLREAKRVIDAIDPSTIDVPTETGGGARTTDEIRDLAKRDGVRMWMRRGELKHLPQLLARDECVEKIVRGRYPKHLGVLAATNRRLILLDAGIGHAHVEEFRYGNITSAGMKSGMSMGTVVMHVAGHDAEIDQVPKRDATKFTVPQPQRLQLVRDNTGCLVQSRKG